MIILWIIVSIILFSVIVLIHEFWHFSMARLFNVKVEEFWLWIPPRAKKLFRDKKWTLFTLNWLPIWWFVKLTWEMPNTFLVYNKKKELYNNIDLEKDIKKWKDIFFKSGKKIWKHDKKEILKRIKENSSPENLMNKPAWQQAIIILAWVFMNFLFASIIFSILFFIWVKPIWINSKIETDLSLQLIPTYEQAMESWLLKKGDWLILSPVEWSLAEKSWIIKGDLVYQILTDDEKINKIKAPEDFINIIKSNIWKEIELIIRSTTYKQIKTIKIKIPEEWKIWSYISENISINRDYEIKYSFLEAIDNWIKETWNQALLTVKWVWILIKKIFRPKNAEERKEAISQVSWPVWIVDFISNSMAAWFIFLIIIWAVISINLWVFNLLPIPALDGWRFLFITINWLIEKLFWKKAINEKTEWIIHVLFFVFLIALSLLIAYNDINKIILR